jgi:hypothetical protein
MRLDKKKPMPWQVPLPTRYALSAESLIEIRPFFRRSVICHSNFRLQKRTISHSEFRLILEQIKRDKTIVKKPWFGMINGLFEYTDLVRKKLSNLTSDGDDASNDQRLEDLLQTQREAGMDIISPLVFKFHSVRYLHCSRSTRN